VEGGISFLAADYDLLYRWLGWVSIRREELSTTAYGPGGFGGTSRVKGA